MVTHVVLFRPRPGLSDAERQRFADALAAARREIPSIVRFRVGRRLVLGAAYDQGMPDLPYAALIEFEDEAGLRAYLAHPAHADVGRLFGEMLDAALVYDLETTEDPAALRRLAGLESG